MPEEIKNYVAPIAYIPKQSMLAAEIHQLRLSLNRKRKDSEKAAIKTQLDAKRRELDAYLRSIGRWYCGSGGGMHFGVRSVAV